MMINTLKQLMKNRNPFTHTKLITYRFFSSSLNSEFKEAPFHISHQNKKSEDLFSAFDSRKDKYQNRNTLYKDFFNINQRIKNSENLIKFFDVDSLIAQQAFTQSANLKLEYPGNDQTEQIKSAIEKINNFKLNPKLSSKENINEFKNNINSLISQFESRRSQNSEKYTQLAFIQDYSKIINFLFAAQSRVNFLINEISFVQENLLNYLNVLNSFEEIPLEIVKGNFELLFRATYNYLNQKDKFKNIVNFEGKFNSTLAKTLESFLITLKKYSGEKSADLATGYFLLGYFHLKMKDFSTSENYSVKSNEILKKLEQEEKKYNIDQIQPLFLIGELYAGNYGNLVESYSILKQAFDIFTQSKESQFTTGSVINQILIAQICERLGDMYSIESNSDAIESYQYAVNQINKLVVHENYELGKTLMKILSRLSELYTISDFKRKEYEVNKYRQSLLDEKLLNSDLELERLLMLFKYSDDYNSYLAYLNQDNISPTFFRDFSKYLLMLFNHSVTKKSDFISGNLLYEVIKGHIIPINRKIALSDEYLLTYHSLSLLLKKNCLEIDSALSHANSAKELVYNSQSYNMKPKEKLLTLIKLHFNSAYLYILDKQTPKVVEDFEASVKLINQIMTESSSMLTYEEKAKLYEFSSTLQILLANLYLTNNDSIKSEICLSNITEILSKSDMEDFLVFNLDKRNALLGYMQEFKSQIEKQTK